MSRNARGISGQVEYEGKGIMLAWAALVDGAAFENCGRRKQLGSSITDSMSSIDWSNVGGGKAGEIKTISVNPPMPVWVDRKLEDAVASLPKDGLIAIAISVRIPGVDLPCGGVIWAESDNGSEDGVIAAPMSFPLAGLCMWAEAGEWCILAECAPSTVVKLVKEAKQAKETDSMDAILEEARTLEVSLMIMVADATGRNEGAGGVCYIAGGEANVLKI